MRISCDLDRPFKYNIPLKRLPRRLAGSLIKRRSITDAKKLLFGTLLQSTSDAAKDPWYKNVDWIMDVNERENNKVDFFLICGGNHPVDADYRLEAPLIRKMITNIVDRGHSVGLHPSYDCFKNETKTQLEFNTLTSFLSQIGARKCLINNRFHYLRWNSEFSPRILENVGLYSDSSLYYSNVAGFRAGTAKTFRMFDHVGCQLLKIKQHPLTFMESSILSNYGHGEEALSYVETIKYRAQKLGGCFSMLWHNSDLNTDDDYNFYLRCIKGK